jgi:uncharacterized membrane protein
MPSTASPFLLDAVLSPHRSLPPRGFLVLMLAFGGVSFAAGLLFASMGAWPVLGFFGLDVLLFYIAFRISYRRARLREIVRVTRQQVTVRRVQPDGRQTLWQFEPAWVRVELHRPEEHDCRLELASGRQSLALGAFLSPEERVEFAATLRAALRAARTFPRPSASADPA